MKNKRCTNCGRFPLCPYDYTTCLIPYIARFGYPQGPSDTIKDYWLPRNTNIKGGQSGV